MESSYKFVQSIIFQASFFNNCVNSSQHIYYIYRFEVEYRHGAFYTGSNVQASLKKKFVLLYL